MPLAINDLYVSVFDYSVNYNLNTKLITITDTSTYINSAGVSGIVFTMTAPNGATGTLSISHGGSGTIAMPTINGGVVYGFYTISGVLTDTTTSYTYAKAAFNICKPTQCDGTKNSDGCLDTTVAFFCLDNKVLYADNTSYTYKDTDATTVTRDVTVIDPNNVTQVDSSNSSSFYISPIVNGRYSFTIINSAVYTFSDSVTVTIVYQASNQQYTAACDINLCDFECPLSELEAEITLLGNNGSAEYRNLIVKRDEISFLLGLANIQIRCGSDNTSDTISRLEKLTGVKCSCGCGGTNVNLPICCEQTIVMTEGGGDIELEQTTSGDTTTFTISDQHYDFTAGTGISISEVTAGTTTTVTISSSSSDILVANTAFVSKSGNDSTGVMGDFSKPFLTIKKAVGACTSNSNHLVYVFPGSYSEASLTIGTDAVEKTGLNYYFSPGVIVVSVGNTFKTSIVGTTIIRGGGIFQASSDVIDSNANCDWDVQCTSLQMTGATSSGVFFRGGGTFKLKCSTITSTGGGCVDIRSVTSTGYVECDLFDNQTGAASTPCVKMSLTGTHLWTFYVKELKTMSNAANNCGGVVNIAAAGKIYWKGNIFQNQTVAAGFCAAISVNTGIIVYQGDITTVTGYGGICISGTLALNNATVRVGGDWAALAILDPPGDGLLIANNCMLVNTSATIATISHSAGSTGSMQLGSCLISNLSTNASSRTVQLTNASQALRMNNCNLYLGAGAGNSIQIDANVNGRFVNCWTNKTTAGAFTLTNLISAINVDADLIQTIYT